MIVDIFQYFIYNLIFRSAREAEALERKARESGETLPTEKRFDSNCITPGKVFWFAIIIVIFCNVYSGHTFNIFFTISEIKCHWNRNNFSSLPLTGTEFMVKLHEQLKYFVTSKISSDPLWHGVDVYLSGHEVKL